MTCRKSDPIVGRGARTDLLVLLYARAEFAREQLDIAVSRGASRRVIEVLLDQRTAAISELAAAVGIVPASDFDFFQAPPSAA